MTTFSITYGVVDGKGKQSKMTLYTTDNGTDFTAIVNAVQQSIPIIIALINGKVESVNLCANLSGLLAGQGGNVADPNSDVEEGALFLYEVLGGYAARNRVPTFDEALLISGSTQVDRAAQPVIDFEAMMEVGLSVLDGTGATVTQQFTDYRGTDIIELEDAYESFQSSGSRR